MTTRYMSWIIRANIISFALLALLFPLPIEAFSIGRITYALVAVLAIFILPGINLAVILRHCLKQNLSSDEILAISPMLSLTVIPTALALEHDALDILFPSLPLVNAIAVFVALLILSFRNPESVRTSDSPLTRYLTTPLLLASFLLYSVVAWNITSAFYALPDLDPYYWLTSSREMIAQGSLPLLSGYRPAFISLTYIFNQGASVDLYAFFKDVLPLFYLFLIPSFFLVSQRLTVPLQKAVVFLFPFINGVSFLYTTESIPQSIVSILISSSVSLTAYSFLSRKTVFFVLAGIPLFFGYFYHEIAAIPFLLWFAVACVTFRRNIVGFVSANRLSSLLLILLILPYLGIPLSFLSSHITILTDLFTNIRPNFLFPGYYVNVDGNQMGWEDPLGIVKYYLFYAGTTIILLLAAVIAFPKDVAGSVRRVSARPEILVALLSCGTFFAIAEILPRFAGFAFLPERAWIFIGPYVLLLLLPIFGTSLGRNNVFLWILVATFSVNLGGALYVNALKKYVITDAQLVSAAWIRNSLPDDRTFFTIDNQKLLGFFSESKIISITDPNFYFDHDAFLAEFSRYQNGNQTLPLDLYQKQLGNTASRLGEMTLERSREKMDQTTTVLGEEIGNLEKIRGGLSAPTDGTKRRHFYIYYAATNRKNPYIDRPYVLTVPEASSQFIFDRFPEFRRIYSDSGEKIYIWEIL